MPEIAVTKDLTESMTIAEINLSNNNLTTIAKNDSVEVRIALNNDKQDSDLYINPSFELVFPKYVKNVTVENINLVYACGLQISNYQIYSENDLVKMRIELEGVQNVFSESVITNGTNILLNLNIELDEYTPRKQDQIKMYYYNEGVTNYQSQTKWTIGKQIPNGILKQTNGFDVAVINYQAPLGLITSNAMINYDGQSSKIQSINQGERTVEIKTNSNSQIATMELVAMNSTGNTCTDAVFIGRIPFKGNKSVVTNKDLGTTATVGILSGITENIQNVNMTTIYYSTNENATKDLKNTSNAWTTEVSDLSQIKSYMIVVKGEMLAGTVLKYTYDFEIPSGLSYDEAIYGSFGGYYNNNYESVVAYESTEADMVGVVTEKEPEIKITVSPYGSNKNIYYGQDLTLKAKIENNSKDDIVNSMMTVSIPSNTIYTELQVLSNENATGVHDEYVKNKEVKEVQLPIELLKVGESKELEFNVKVQHNENETADLVGNISMSGLQNDVKYTNNYKLTAKKGKIGIDAYVPGSSTIPLSNNEELVYYIDIRNSDSENLENVKASFELSKHLSITEVKRVFEDDVTELPYNNENGKVTIDVGTVEKEATIGITTTVKDIKTQKAVLKSIFDIYKEENNKEIYSSNVINTDIEQPLIEVYQTCSAQTDLNYYDEIEYKIAINNNSSTGGNIEIKDEFPETANISKIITIVNGVEEEVEYPMNKFYKSVELQGNDSIQIIASGKLIDWDDTNEGQTITNMATVSLRSGETFKSNKISTKILKPQEIKEDEEIDETEEIEEEIEEENEIEDEVEEKTQEDIEFEEYMKERFGVDITDTEENDDEEQEQAQTITSNIIQGQYSISGNAWVDSNGDSIKNEDEVEAPSGVQVQLLQGSTMIKATTTNAEGNYTFTDLPEGDYTVVFNYDSEKYTSSNYVSNEAEEKSKSVEIEVGKAVTDTITITDTSVENINSGLTEKEKFDLQLKQYITKAIVNVNGEEKEYAYEDLELAKLEIKPSELKKATVKLEYKLMVENVGNVDGQVTSIVDYVPNGLTFNEAENEGWSNGAIKGNVYYDGLKGTNIAPGETQEITLVLNKKMTEDNTGVVSNKAKIAYTESMVRLTEAQENNFASQETIVTITQGLNKKVSVAITISMVIIVTIFAYMVNTGKIQISVNVGKGIKKVYK